MNQDAVGVGGRLEFVLDKYEVLVSGLGDCEHDQPMTTPDGIEVCACGRVRRHLDTLRVKDD